MSDDTLGTSKVKEATAKPTRLLHRVSQLHWNEGIKAFSAHPDFDLTCFLVVQPGPCRLQLAVESGMQVLESVTEPQSSGAVVGR